MWKRHLHWWILGGIVLGALLGTVLNGANIDAARLEIATREFLARNPALKRAALTGERMAAIRAIAADPSFLRRRAADLSAEMLATGSRLEEASLELATRELLAANPAIEREGLTDAHKAEIRALAADPAFRREQAAAVNTRLEASLKPTFVYSALDGLARIFLNLLKMIVIPLVFFTLVSGLLGLEDLKRLGRIGLKTLAWYMTTSLVAIVTGLLLVNAIGPGVGSGIRMPTERPDKPVPESFWDVLVKMVPDNVFGSMASFDMFGVIFFSLLFGIFILRVETRKREALSGFIVGGTEVMMAMVGFVIALAPVGIVGLVARMVAVSGPQVFINLLPYILTVFSALAVHAFVTLPLLMWLFTRRNPYAYMRAMSPALLTGFSTASSSGTLPLTMERAEKGAGISNRVTSFVLPLGATINMDGTALYECVTVLFIAQVHAGLDPNFTLTFGQQLLIVFLALMVSIGAAGIPHAGLVMMVIILKAVNLPLEYTALIWSVDRALDMCRTCVNIWSDASGALVIAHTEGEVRLEEGAAASADAP
jgi:proton glutamate symport protein